MTDVQIIKSIMVNDYYIVFKDGERKGSIKRKGKGYILTLYYKVNFVACFASLVDAMSYAKEML